MLVLGPEKHTESKLAKKQSKVVTKTESDSDSDKDDLFTVKKIHDWREDEEDMDHAKEAVVVDSATLLKMKQKKEKIKIRADGTARGNDGTTKRIIFDESGEVISDPLKQIVFDINNQGIGTKKNREEEIEEVEKRDSNIFSKTPNVLAEYF